MQEFKLYRPISFMINGFHDFLLFYPVHKRLQFIINSRIKFRIYCLIIAQNQITIHKTSSWPNSGRWHVVDLQHSKDQTLKPTGPIGCTKSIAFNDIQQKNQNQFCDYWFRQNIVYLPEETSD